MGNDKQQSVTQWIGVALAAIPGIKQLVDLFRNETRVDGLPCRLKYRRKHEYTECRACGMTYKGHVSDTPSQWPGSCPFNNDDQ